MTTFRFNKRAIALCILFLGTLSVIMSCSDKDAEIQNTPTITSYSSSAALIGTNITITGSNFGTSTDDVEVYFYDYETAEVLEVTNTTLLVTIPANAYVGPIKVKIKTKEVEGPVFDVLMLCFFDGIGAVPCPRVKPG